MNIIEIYAVKGILETIAIAILYAIMVRQESRIDFLRKELDYMDKDIEILGKREVSVTDLDKKYSDFQEAMKSSHQTASAKVETIDDYDEKKGTGFRVETPMASVHVPFQNVTSTSDFLKEPTFKAKLAKESERIDDLYSKGGPNHRFTTPEMTQKKKNHVYYMRAQAKKRISKIK